MMYSRIRKLALLLAALAFCLTTYAQTQVAIKTNALSDAMLNANIGAEVAVGPRWSVGADVDFNFWSGSGDKLWKHLWVQPEARYWLCDPMAGHFFAANLIGGIYNTSGINLNWLNLLDNDFYRPGTRVQGWMAGAGVAYGYSWLLSRRWSLEAEIGIGYAYSRYDRYPCASCGTKIEEGKSQHYFGPTKAAISLVYTF